MRPRRQTAEAGTIESPPDASTMRVLWCRSVRLPTARNRSMSPLAPDGCRMTVCSEPSQRTCDGDGAQPPCGEGADQPGDGTGARVRAIAIDGEPAAARRHVFGGIHRAPATARGFRRSSPTGTPNRSPTRRRPLAAGRCRRRPTTPTGCARCRSLSPRGCETSILDVGAKRGLGWAKRARVGWRRTVAEAGWSRQPRRLTERPWRVVARAADTRRLSISEGQHAFAVVSDAS